MPLTDTQMKALDHEKSLCFVAGAGTGKTTVLVQKYLDILNTRPDVGVRDILALTFMDKAAADMKKKIRGELAKLEGERWEKTREDFIWANISTFHSFCSGVLRDFSVEAGLEPGFSTLDEKGSHRLKNEAWDSLLHGTNPKKTDETLTRLLQDTNPRTLEEILNDIAKKHDLMVQVLEKLDNPKNIFNAWKGRIKEDKLSVISRFNEDSELLGELTRLANAYHDVNDGGGKYLTEIRPYLEKIESPDMEVSFNAIRNLFSGTNRKAKGSKEKWKAYPQDLESLKNTHAGLLQVMDETDLESLWLDSDNQLHLALEFLKDIRGVYLRYNELYERKKTQQNAIDFNDMIRLTKRLFDRHPEIVREHFTKKIRYILVDEFQDTDPDQYDIIWNMLGTEEEAKEKLFIVGDPKQSIYQFREADVTLFGLARKRIEGMGGDTVTLDTSFRSAPQIIDFVNHLFAQLLESRSEPWESGYDPLNVSDRRKNDRGSVQLLFGDASGQKDLAESEIVSRRIKTMVGETEVYWEDGDYLNEPRKAQYRDFAILIHRRKMLPYLEKELTRYGIPYHIHGGIGFYGRQEVRDIHNIINFLSNPLDDVSLFAILRSPYFGISDTTLYKARKSRHGQLWDDVLEYIDKEECMELECAVSRLNEWLNICRRIPISSLLNKIVRKSGIRAVYSGLGSVGEQALGNLEKILEMAKDTQQDGFTGLDTFALYLSELLNEEPRESQAQLELESGDTVKILTVHKAKGLEFPIVVVADTGGVGQSAKRNKSNMLVDPKHPEIPNALGTKYPDPENNYIKGDNFILKQLKDAMDAKELAEWKRLFYVAATRAKDHLVLSSCHELGKNSWMESLVKILDVTDEHMEGSDINLAFEDQDGITHSLDIGVTTDPGQLNTAPVEESRVLIDIPIGADLETPLPDELTPIGITDPEVILSPTSLALKENDPKEYRRRHELSLPEEKIGAASTTMTASIRGTIIHEIFRGKNPASVLRSFGFDNEEMAKEFARYYSEFLKHQIMQDIQEKHEEVPFQIVYQSQTMRGQIDLLLRTADDRWVIIDYKSNKIKSGEEEKTAAEYTIQMAVYTEAARQLLGVQDIDAYLYFTETGMLTKV